MSRGFLCTLGGIALTAIGYFGLWDFPASPAYAVINLIWGRDPFEDLEPLQRVSLVIALLVLCVAFWAVWLAAAMMILRSRNPARS